MDKILERLKNAADEESRYAYADAVTNAFLTAQIKALREGRGMTQEKLAELVGTQQSGISRWLNTGFSTCKVESLRKFAKAYGVRLRISFEEFGTLPSDVRGFTKERLAPKSFADDPVFNPQQKESQLESTIAGKLALQALANLKKGDLPQSDWSRRLKLAGEAMRLKEKFPILCRSFQELASAKAITAESVGSPIQQEATGRTVLRPYLVTASTKREIDTEKKRRRGRNRRKTAA